MKLIVLKNSVPLNEVLVDTQDFNDSYEIYVGRSEDCHVRIDDPLISRHHFVIKNEGKDWYCEKLSQLGVLTLNGSLVSKSRVVNGDEIKAGAYSIILAELPVPLVEESGVRPQLSAGAPEPSLSGSSMPPLEEEQPTEIIPPPKKSEPVKVKKPEPVPEPEVFEEVLEEPLASELSDDGPGVLDLQEGSSDLDSFTDAENDLGSEGGFEGRDEPEEAEPFNAPVESSEPAYDESSADPGGDENEKTSVFKAFVNYQLVLFGEHAPYDRFQIDRDEVYIGREPKKCQIILNDPEVSSVHAVVRKNLSEITLEDLNSSNGTILNGERINKATIVAGDEFVIGGTSFTLEVRSDLLENESERLMPVESGQVVETEEIIEEEIAADGDINFAAEGPPEKSIIKRIWKDPAKRKKAIYGVVALGLIYLFLGDSEEKPATDGSNKTAKTAPVKPEDKNAKPKKLISKEDEAKRNMAYENGVSWFEQQRYDNAEIEFQKVISIDPDYKKVKSYMEQTKIGLQKVAELEAQRKAEEDRIKLKKLIDELLQKAREAVKDRQVQVAESFFSQIIEKDPENIEVTQLKLELESWQKEQERIALEKAAKEAARKKMVDALTPGKTSYIKKEWYRAILKLEEFLRTKSLDEDLVRDATEMLSDAKNQLASEIGPLIGKARSLKEGQDYRAAYEAFMEILKIEPTNAEALNEADDIKSQLDARSKKIYREAIIAESLSLFNDAKEKFQEVQQISPTDSEYYKKATEKLRNYLE